MSNTWVQKIRKNEIIRNQKAKENRTKDTVPPPKLEVKLIVERARANKQRYAVVYLPECKLRRSKTLSLEDIKSKSKTESQRELDGLQIGDRKKKMIENGVKNLQRKKIERPGPNGGIPHTKELNKFNM